jgi:hypothetical protein
MSNKTSSRIHAALIPRNSLHLNDKAPTISRNGGSLSQALKSQKVGQGRAHEKPVMIMRFAMNTAQRREYDAAVSVRKTG